MQTRQSSSPLARVVAEYESWLRSWASSRTTNARVALARKRLAEWGLDGFTPTNIQDFLGGPKPDSGKKPWSGWTKATYYGHMTDLCKWLVATGRLTENPMEEVRMGKRPGPAPRPLSEAEAARVMSVVEGEVRDWLLLAMLAGLRVSEIARIRGEDVSDDGIYVRGKGDVIAVLPCHPDLRAMALRYPRDDYWFPGSHDGHIPSQHISMTVGRLFRSLGIKGSIHRCRHLYATRLLRNGVHVRRVQKLMRHSMLETTAAYTAVDEDELREAILLLPSIDTPSPAA